MSYEKQEWINNVSYIDKGKMDHIENGIYGNSVELELLKDDIYDEIFYKSGDTYSSSYLPLSGFITSGTTEIEVSLILPKKIKLDRINTITVTELAVFIRGISGYLNNDATAKDYLSDSDYTISTSIKSSNAITITIKKSTAFTNVTNNTPIEIAGNIGLTFTYQEA